MYPAMILMVSIVGLLFIIIFKDRSFHEYGPLEGAEYTLLMLGSIIAYCLIYLAIKTSIGKGL